MRKAAIYLREMFVGEVTELSKGNYVFRYDDDYFFHPSKPDLSLTLNKSKQEYTSRCLFPFFANLLSEGQSRKMQAALLGIDEKDDFGILLATAQYDVVGAVTVKAIQ